MAIIQCMNSLQSLLSLLLLLVLLFVFLVDSSIIFLGQVFYLEKQLNQWEMRLIVVKHLEAFANVGILLLTRLTSIMYHICVHSM